MAEEMNALELTGVLFRPIIYRPFYGRWKDSTLSGVEVHIIDESAAELLPIQFHFLEVHHRLYPDRNPFARASAGRLNAFDRAAGTDQVRRHFAERMQYADIREYLGKDIAPFRTVSAKYHLYR
jgi:uncharacterized protein YbbC (DUF1343 family)